MSKASGGHAYLAVGYTTTFINGTLKYRYTLNDPWPWSEPNPWDAPQSTSGQNYLVSYNWICNGKNAEPGDNEDSGIWEGYITVVTDYSDESLPPITN